MTRLNRNQQGLAHMVVLVLILAVVAAVAFAGYRVAKNNSDNTTSTANSGSSRLVAVPKQINSKADLSKANQALDNTSIESGVDPNSLNSDLSAIQ